MRSQDFPNLVDIHMTLFRKQIGILLQHKRSKPGGIHQETCAKRSHSESFERSYESPIYPEILVPSLIELLDRENHAEHDSLRFKLLKWSINEDDRRDRGLEKIPKKYFLDVLTLMFLRRKGFISVVEADLILFTVKNVELGLIPDIIKPPDVVNERAFRISFLYTKTAVSIERSLEITGLKDSMMVSSSNNRENLLN